MSVRTCPLHLYIFYEINERHKLFTVHLHSLLIRYQHFCSTEGERRTEAIHASVPTTVSTGVDLMEEELCLVDSGTTNSILRETKYFQTLTKRQGNVLTIAGRDATIIGSGRAIIVLPMGTQITIEDALLYPDSKRTLLSYRDIRQNGFHIETFDDNNEEILHI